MKAKEALVRRSAFSKPLPNPIEPPITPRKMAHTKITEEIVAPALMTPAATKAPGLDKINFRILQMMGAGRRQRLQA